MLVLTRKVGERILIGDVRAVTEANVEAASATDEGEAQIRDLLGGQTPPPADSK